KNVKNVKNKKDITKVISSVELKPNCELIINYLNKKTGRNYDPKNKSNMDLLRARFNEGRTPKDFQDVIDKKVEDWLTDDKMNTYLRPSTLFNRTKFENYLNEPKKDKFDKYLKTGKIRL
ncbi:conserved phage C-terminal domain-containing protein, partial [bacterium]|nr:conserved phage C-terminal domain-containing protein [bacterium]